MILSAVGTKISIITAALTMLLPLISLFTTLKKNNVVATVLRSKDRAIMAAQIAGIVVGMIIYIFMCAPTVLLSDENLRHKTQ